jgi:YD repeat-containing protein
VNPLIRQAVRSQRVLRLAYDGYERVVEPHAYGRDGAGRDVLRVWQLSGGPGAAEPSGWQLLRVDEVRGVSETGDAFPHHRPGYKRGDKEIPFLYAQL